MTDVFDKIIKTIECIERTPKMLFKGPISYSELKSFFLGYFVGVEDHYKVAINHSFSEYLNNKYKKTSLFWTEYIIEIISKGDENMACKVLLQELKSFLSDFKDSLNS